LSNFPMYSDGQSANFTPLCNLSICNASLKQKFPNFSSKMRNHEWTCSHIPRLRISRDITE
ncbi:hypothetical protein T11_10983, partial [Trichinella zimbabwensis]